MELPYLKQDCELTLNEGLELHYGVNSTFKENVIKVPAFYNHDIVHVLFGLETTVENESLADTRVIFATNWGFKKYFNDYMRNPDAIKIIMKIFKDIGYVRGIVLSIKSLPNLFRVIIDCKKMSKKWGVNPDDRLLNTKLSELRKEYNIKVIN